MYNIQDIYKNSSRFKIIVYLTTKKEQCNTGPTIITTTKYIIKGKYRL